MTLEKVGAVKSVRASYANFTWGVPEEIDAAYPTLGTSTAVGQGEAARRIIIVQKDSPADRAGIKVGDVITSFDGTPIPDKETLSRLMSAKRWGDSASVGVRRGDQALTLTAVFRRSVKTE